MIASELVVIHPLPASIEILPKQIPTRDQLRNLLSTGTRVYLTDIGTPETSAEMLSAARLLNDIGCIPVPHIAARRIRSREDLETRIAALTEQAGVNDVLVIGGGISRAAGPYSCTMTLLESGIHDRFGIKDIAVAGHQKQAFANQTGARLRIVTQFGFDAERAVLWCENLRKIDIDVPVHIGVAGPAKFATLIKYATHCGVGNSLTLLKKSAENLFSLAAGYSPETYIGPIEKQLAKLARPPITKMHVFPFGGLEAASNWLHSRRSW